MLTIKNKQFRKCVFVYELNNSDYDKILEFIDLVDFKDWPDFSVEAGIQGYAETFRMHQFIEAHDSCPIQTAEAHNSAKKTARRAYFGAIIHEQATEKEAFKSFCDVMQEKYYNTYLRYKWNLLKQFNRNSKIKAVVFYQDYLDDFDPAEYALYSFPFEFSDHSVDQAFASQH